jgi:small multidrug resistance pump
MAAINRRCRRHLMRRRRTHQVVFCAAGAYNITWGLHAAVDPTALFRFADMATPNYPEMWACLGMVIGLYGVIYLEVARRPEQGFTLAAVGLAGKVLGPAGWLVLVLTGRWPLSTIVLVLANDILWWHPFARYLRDAWPPPGHAARPGAARR